MFEPEAVPLRLKFLMLPVATPSARAEPDSSFFRTVAGVSTAARRTTPPVMARSTSVARAILDESALALAIRPARIPGRGRTTPVSFESRPAKRESESTAT